MNATCWLCNGTKITFTINTIATTNLKIFLRNSIRLLRFQSHRKSWWCECGLSKQEKWGREVIVKITYFSLFWRHIKVLKINIDWQKGKYWIKCFKNKHILGCKRKHAKQQYQIDSDTLGCLISWTISKGLY